MPAPLDITSLLPQDGVTAVAAASITPWANLLMYGYDSHVTNSAVGGYGPDQHTASHILSPGPAINQASSNSQEGLDTRLSELATRIVAIEGGSPATWAAGTAATNLAAIAAAITGHTIVAASAATATTASGVPATGITGTVSLNAISQDHKVIPQTGGAVLKVTVRGGRWVNGTTGLPLGVLADADVTLATQPGGSNNRYDAVYRNPDGSLGGVTGVAAASPSLTAYPTTPGVVGLANVLVRNTSGTTAIPAADILDDRGPGTASGGGSGGAPSTLDFLTLSDQSGVYTNSRGAAAFLGGTTGTGNTYLLHRPRALDATTDDALKNTVGGAYIGSLSISGAKAVMTVSTGPIFFNAGGKQRVLAAGSLTSQAGSGGVGVASASGSAGAVWRICLDFGVTGPIFALTLVGPTTTITDPNLSVVGTSIFDGTNLTSDSIEYTAGPSIDSGMWRPNTLYMPAAASALTVSGNTAATAPFGVMPGTFAVAKNFSAPKRGFVVVEALVTQAATAAVDITVGLLKDSNGTSGNSIGGQWFFQGLDFAATRVRSLTLYIPFEGTNALPAGSYSFQPYAIVSSNTNPVTFTNQTMYGQFYSY